MHTTSAIHMSIMISYPTVLLVTQPECRRPRGRHPAAEAGQLQEGM
ncbi:MAG: hypothetical protein ACRDQU_06740 [Pseudonocardiaceae bacterium]